MTARNYAAKSKKQNAKKRIWKFHYGKKRMKNSLTTDYYRPFSTYSSQQVVLKNTYRLTGMKSHKEIT
jgi:hypothetical protein